MSRKRGRGEEREGGEESLQQPREGGKKERTMSKGSRKRRAMAMKYMPERKKEKMRLQADLKRQLEWEKKTMGPQELQPVFETPVVAEALEELPSPPVGRRAKKSKGSKNRMQEERQKKIQGAPNRVFFCSSNL